MAVIYGAHIVTSAAIIALLPVILEIYGLSEEAAYGARVIVVSHGVMMCLIWPLAYTLPVVFRAAGDARFPMAVSTVSMLLCRLALAYVLCSVTDWGMLATWAAMFIDWLAKAAIFTVHYLRGRWIALFDMRPLKAGRG